MRAVRDGFGADADGQLGIKSPGSKSPFIACKHILKVKGVEVDKLMIYSY